MQTESDPNILYGGDLIESTEPISDQYKSLGDLILSDLKLGENKTSFVSWIKNLPEWDQRLIFFISARSMDHRTKFGHFAICSTIPFRCQKLFTLPASRKTTSFLSFLKTATNFLVLPSVHFVWTQLWHLTARVIPKVSWCDLEIVWDLLLSFKYLLTLQNFQFCQKFISLFLITKMFLFWVKDYVI